ncbi:hypothetical protein [Streptomyces sp. G-5]|uniref:hypothetical protein n=1 Tax=Streptomyces sp. G-5 TaxID=2977231 RepID=UPI0021D3E306|nr:hypothetical protein [Streptomyces sp. G-5]MCU4750217.1 hypothetical protein [Streptomyces sp. G-5]
MTTGSSPDSVAGAYWSLDSDTRGEHHGFAFGHLPVPDGDSQPVMYRVRHTWHLRTFTAGIWSGPDTGRPTTDPDLLQPACSCGWMSDALVEFDDGPHAEQPHFTAAARLTGEDAARAHWLDHALAATSDAIPRDAEAAAEEAIRHLRYLAARQPLAALRLATRLAAAIEEAVPTAAATGRALGITWDRLATAAGEPSTSTFHRRNRPAADAGVPPEALTPAFMPDHLVDGSLPYTITLHPHGTELPPLRPADPPAPAAAAHDLPPDTRPAPDLAPYDALLQHPTSSEQPSPRAAEVPAPAGPPAQEAAAPPTVAQALASGDIDQVAAALFAATDPAGEIEDLSDVSPDTAALLLTAASRRIAASAVGISRRTYELVYLVAGAYNSSNHTTHTERLRELAAVDTERIKLPADNKGHAFRAALELYKQTANQTPENNDE